VTGGQLDELRWHWGDAYLIRYLGGRWVAQRRDSHETISADDPAALLDLIRQDYGRRPVSRAVAPGAGRPETPGCRFLPEG
jgi:hypothetical protein